MQEFNSVKYRPNYYQAYVQQWKELLEVHLPKVINIREEDETNPMYSNQVFKISNLYP